MGQDGCGCYNTEQHELTSELQPGRMGDPRNVRFRNLKFPVTPSNGTVSYLQTFTKKKADRSVVFVGTIRNKSEERIPGTNKTVTRIRGVYFDQHGRDSSGDYNFRYRDDASHSSIPVSRQPESQSRARQSRFRSVSPISDDY